MENKLGEMIPEEGDIPASGFWEGKKGKIRGKGQ